MIEKLPRVLLATTLLSFLGLGDPQDCVAQVASKASETTASHSASRKEQVPFDKLELFAFLAAAPPDPYARQVIQERGANFAPDAAFIASFPFPGFQVILRNVRPRGARVTFPDRDAAYELLRRAWDANRKRQFASASENYERALQVAPNSATLHLAYATNLMFAKNYPAADVQARESLKLWPENGDAHGALALALTAQRQFPQAESEAREALRIFPNHHSAMFALAMSLTYERKYTEAIPVAQNLIAAIPTMPETRKFLGISLFETGKIEEGISQLSLYVKNAPKDSEGYYYLGVALRSKGRSEEARAQFAEALRLQPSNPVYEAAAHPDATVSATDAVTGPRAEEGSISENVYTNKFFGFTYEFPKGWVSESEAAARAVMNNGAALILKDDPTEADIKKAAGSKSHPLLYVVERGTGNQTISLKSVMVIAVDIGQVPEVTGESFLKSIVQRYKQTGLPMELSETPEETTIAGRNFWKGTLAIQTAMGSHYASQFVTTDKGYLLVFVVGGPDPMSLQEIEKSLGSVHFVDNSK